MTEQDPIRAEVAAVLDHAERVNEVAERYRQEAERSKAEAERARSELQEHARRGGDHHMAEQEGKRAYELAERYARLSEESLRVVQEERERHKREKSMLERALSPPPAMHAVAYSPPPRVEPFIPEMSFAVEDMRGRIADLELLLRGERDKVTFLMLEKDRLENILEAERQRHDYERDLMRDELETRLLMAEQEMRDETTHLRQQLRKQDEELLHREKEFATLEHDSALLAVEKYRSATENLGRQLSLFRRQVDTDDRRELPQSTVTEHHEHVTSVHSDTAPLVRLGSPNPKLPPPPPVHSHTSSDLRGLDRDTTTTTSFRRRRSTSPREGWSRSIEIRPPLDLVGSGDSWRRSPLKRATITRSTELGRRSASPRLKRSWYTSPPRADRRGLRDD